MVEARRPWCSERDVALFGVGAAVLFAALLWYAAWTVECNVLVLTGRHYAWFLWAPLPPTILVLAASPFARVIADRYASTVRYGPPPSRLVEDVRLGAREWLMLGGAATIAFVAADLGNRRPTAVPYVAACALVAWVVRLIGRRRGGTLFAPLPVAIGWRLPVLAVLLFAIYYFSHYFDGDDANFVNLAVGAQQTHGAVFQFDTMLGDGPNPIHLPTYKFHAFELLGAVLSSYTGLEPIAVFHLLLPAIELPLLALVLMAMLAPACGRHWLAAALVWLAFLFLNEPSLAGWGLQGIVRLYEGKGFLVSALLPLMAALTVRWFALGQRIDLLALLLAAICAIGFSANGLYDGPAAIALVAAALLVPAIRSRPAWSRALQLMPTIAYPVVVAVVIVTCHLALPSEQTGSTAAIAELNWVTRFGWSGRLTLCVMAFGGLGLLQVGTGSVGALLYLPLAMLLTLNPVSWQAISAITGNLGFRIFWALPIASLVALAVIAALRLAGVRSERAVLAIASVLLIGSIVGQALARDPLTTIRWGWPDLKVDRADYERAARLAARVSPACRILAPERYAQLISTMRGAPHPVFVRALYLIHYRFTLPRDQLALRNRLRLVVDGPSPVAPPAPRVLAAAGIPIGELAVGRDAPSRASAEALARSLNLSGPVHDGPLLIWTGTCHE